MPATHLLSFGSYMLAFSRAPFGAGPVSFVAASEWEERHRDMLEPRVEMGGAMGCLKTRVKSHDSGGFLFMLQSPRLALQW